MYEPIAHDDAQISAASRDTRTNASIPDPEPHDSSTALPEARSATSLESQATRSPGMVAAITRGKHSVNGDAYADGECSGQDGIRWPFLVLADGVGGASHGSESAHIAVRVIADLVRKAVLADSADALSDLLHAALDAARLALNDEMLARGETAGHAQEWTTTIIVAQETLHWIGLAYLGDGSIFHAPAEYGLEDIGTGVVETWRWRNLISPHIREDQRHRGQSALARYLSPSAESARPSVHMIRKDLHGDALVLCTDGVASANDDRPMLWTAPEGADIPLLTVSPGALEFCGMLVQTWQQKAPPTRRDLEENMAVRLAALRSNPLTIEDDCTVGVMLTAGAFDLRWGGGTSRAAEHALTVLKDDPLGVLPDTQTEIGYPSANDAPIKEEAQAADGEIINLDPGAHTGDNLEFTPTCGTPAVQHVKPHALDAVKRVLLTPIELKWVSPFNRERQSR